MLPDGAAAEKYPGSGEAASEIINVPISLDPLCARAIPGALLKDPNKASAGKLAMASVLESNVEAIGIAVHAGSPPGE